MKQITLRDGDIFKTRQILSDVMRLPGRGIDLEEMRRRCRVLAVLEKAQGSSSVNIEDADFDVLCSAIKANQWGMADVELLQIIDEVLSAPSV